MTCIRLIWTTRIRTVSLKRAEQGVNLKESRRTNDWISKFCCWAAHNEKKTHTPRICYPWINDGTGAVVFPHRDMNQISTQSSLEVRAGISLTGHLVPEHCHQGVDVATLIVMSPSSSLYVTRATFHKRRRGRGEPLFAGPCRHATSFKLTALINYSNRSLWTNKA